MTHVPKAVKMISQILLPSPESFGQSPDNVSWYELCKQPVVLLQGISFLGPAVCLVGMRGNHSSWLQSTAAGVLSSQGTALVVALLSVSFALGSWARGGLYCNHQARFFQAAMTLLGSLSLSKPRKMTAIRL